MNNSDTMKQVYLLAQKHCGLKVGDYVKVTRKAEDYESGWAFEWLNDADKTIGIVGKICEIHPVGIEVSFTDQNLANCWYPYFVLEKVEKLTHEFKPFDRVLAMISGIWQPNIFLYKRDSGLYQCAYGDWETMIPYKGNEHLVGTTDKPEE